MTVENTISQSTDFLSRPNRTDTANLPQTKVKVQTYHNVYVYEARKLWIAYGSAILFATFAVALGLYTIVATGASYSNEFSTILRVGRHTHLPEGVSPRFDDGRDPLPKDLAKATLTVVRQERIDSPLVEQEPATTESYELLPTGEESSYGTRGL
jgi:hypothetical protein